MQPEDKGEQRAKEFRLRPQILLVIVMLLVLIDLRIAQYALVFTPTTGPIGIIIVGKAAGSAVLEVPIQARKKQIRNEAFGEPVKPLQQTASEVAPVAIPWGVFFGIVGALIGEMFWRKRKPRKTSQMLVAGVVAGAVVSLVVVMGPYIFGRGGVPSEPRETSVISDTSDPDPISVMSDSPLPPPGPNMKRIQIPNVGTIDIPDNMEIQSEEFQDGKEEYLEEKGLVTPEYLKTNVIIMQKGLDKYARIIVYTIMGKPGDYAKLSEHYSLTAQESDEISRQLRTSTELDLKSLNSKLLEWYSPQVSIINGMTAFITSYRRQLGANPPVLVSEYRFQNDDRMIILSISYRESEGEIWASRLQESLHSFRINNIQ